MQPSTNADFWNERYKGEDYAYGSEPNDFLREHASIFGESARVLSLGEGEGRNAVFLAQRGLRARGLDFSEEGQRKALRLAKARGVTIEYELADLGHYEMKEGIWDGVVSVFCHPPEKERPELFRSVISGLKPGGVFLLESYNKAQLALGTGGPKDAACLLSREELEDAFRGFEILLSRDLVRTIKEGSHHDGTSSVTQFIARKPA
ncbi:MAG: class I SAM-dependent methyltransferase [Bryobacterales bacterium]|nr:class I SAM-dependent methyltransferase [Bryobacterales bacterium]